MLYNFYLKLFLLRLTAFKIQAKPRFKKQFLGVLTFKIKWSGITIIIIIIIIIIFVF